MNVTLPDGTTVQGVPEGTTRAQLAEKLKANGRDVPADWLSPPKPEPKKEEPGMLDKVMDARREAMGAVGEPLMAMGSGLAGKVAGDVAGLGAIPLHAAGAIKTDPSDVKKGVQEALTYQPRTQAGASKFNPLNAIPWLVGAPFNWAAGKLEQAGQGPVTGPLASGGAEAIRQAPAFLGIPGGKAATAAGAGMKTGARELMQSALKPGEAALRTGKAEKAVDTLLDYGINVTKGGVEDLNKRVSDLNSRVSTLIQNSPAVIDKRATIPYVQDKIKDFVKQVAPQEDIAAIQKAWDNFMTHPLLPTNTMSVQLAQELKTGTYKQLGDKAYGELKSADVEAQKTLARALKDEIAKAVPQVRQLNAEESKLLNALDLTERRVLMSANKNPLGLGWLSLSPSHLLGWMADRSELFKSLVARMLNTGSGAAQSVAPFSAPIGFAIGSQAAQQPDRAPTP